jgi:hypothetical protein
MDFSKFIMILLGVYLGYYALNFLYDGFIKKDRKQSDDDDEELSFVGELTEEVEPIEVVDQEEYTPDVVEKKRVKVIDPETFEVQRIIEQEPIIIQVESQGIPYSILMADSKQTFAGLNLV